ncbi:hypothetical protein D3C79_839910 [compost metagenome]
MLLLSLTRRSQKYSGYPNPTASTGQVMALAMAIWLMMPSAANAQASSCRRLMLSLKARRPTITMVSGMRK